MPPSSKSPLSRRQTAARSRSGSRASGCWRAHGGHEAALPPAEQRKPTVLFSQTPLPVSSIRFLARRCRRSYRSAGPGSPRRLEPFGEAWTSGSPYAAARRRTAGWSRRSIQSTRASVSGSRNNPAILVERLSGFNEQQMTAICMPDGRPGERGGGCAGGQSGAELVRYTKR